MAAIIKANSLLSSGGLAVLRRQYSVTDDGTVNYQVDYVCLSQFANNYIPTFRVGSTPPTAIPESMSLLRIAATPTMYDFNTNTQNGITYFTAQYTAASADAGEVITTETQEQRSFSATVIGSIRGNFSGFGTGTQEGEVTLAFDYISTTVRVEAKNPLTLPTVQGRVGSPFNVFLSTISNQIPTITGQYQAGTVETESKTRSTRGTYTYTKSSSGIYETTTRTI